MTKIHIATLYRKLKESGYVNKRIREISSEKGNHHDDHFCEYHESYGRHSTEECSDLE